MFALKEFFIPDAKESLMNYFYKYIHSLKILSGVRIQCVLRDLTILKPSKAHFPEIGQIKEFF